MNNKLSNRAYILTYSISFGELIIFKAQVWNKQKTKQKAQLQKCNIERRHARNGETQLHDRIWANPQCGCDLGPSTSPPSKGSGETCQPRADQPWGAAGPTLAPFGPSFGEAVQSMPKRTVWCRVQEYSPPNRPLPTYIRRGRAPSHSTLYATHLSSTSISF
jgi:hypothetical protein